MEMQGVAFKPRAFERAAQGLEGLVGDVREIYQKGGLKVLEEIPGVGKGIAERIEEFIKTKHIKEYESLKKKIPVDLESLAGIAGLGSKNILKLYRELGVKNLDQLERAAKAGKISRLEGFGDKSEAKILQGIEFAKEHRGRYVLGFVLPAIRDIAARLDKHPHTDKVAVCGSVRRMQETIGDVDMVITSKKPAEVMEDFANMPEVDRVIGNKEKMLDSATAYLVVAPFSSAIPETSQAILPIMALIAILIVHSAARKKNSK